MRQQLDHFLDLSVAQTTFIPQVDEQHRNEAIDLIRNSPQKKLQRLMKARLVHNMKKRNRASEANQSPSTAAVSRKYNSMLPTPNTTKLPEAEAMR